MSILPAVEAKHEIRIAGHESDAAPTSGRRLDPVRISRMLLLLFCLGSGAAAAELLLLEHFEDVLQWIPLVVLALGLTSILWWAASPSRISLRTALIVYGLMLASGIAGLYFHYRGNVEFERELHPSISGVELFSEAIRGATPALAPGTLIYLGLLGLVHAYVARGRVASRGTSSSS